MEYERGVKSLAEMLGVVLTNTGSAPSLLPVWRQLVGDVVARRSRPTRWDNDRLIVQCDGEAWRQALEGERDALSRKLATATGRKRLTLVLEVTK